MVSGLGPRIVVTGLSGAGKTTLGRELANRLRVELIEVDELRHTIRPGERLPPSEVGAYVAEKVSTTDSWVLESSLRGIVPEVWDRATSVVWLHLPRWLHVWQIFRRHGSVLVLGKLSRHGITRRRTLGDLRHTWAVHSAGGAEYEHEIERRQLSAIVVRLRSRAEIRQLVRSVEADLQRDGQTQQQPGREA